MSGEINVISRTQQIIVDPISNSIAVINAGPAGPPGPAGPAGGDTGPQGPPGPPGPSTVSVVRYAELTAQGVNFGGTDKSTGLTTTTFSLPAMADNQFIELSFYVPRIEMSSGSGGYPITDGTIQFRLKNSLFTGTLLYGQSVVPNTRAYDPTSPPSVSAKVLMSKTRATQVFPPGSKLTLWGVLGGVSASQGLARIDADTGSLRPNISMRLV